jgi:hypothetical protein
MQYAIASVRYYDRAGRDNGYGLDARQFAQRPTNDFGCGSSGDVLVTAENQASSIAARVPTWLQISTRGWLLRPPTVRTGLQKRRDLLAGEEITDVPGPGPRIEGLRYSLVFLNSTSKFCKLWACGTAQTASFEQNPPWVTVLSADEPCSGWSRNAGTFRGLQQTLTESHRSHAHRPVQRNPEAW